MKLVDLDPHWLGHGGQGVTETATGKPVPLRERIGIRMNCPCGCGTPLCVTFTNPVDGQGPIGGTTWERQGETFETLTLRPSVQRVGGCNWHGYITDGEALPC